MKKFILVFLVLTAAVFAQNSGEKDSLKIGWFGAPVMKFTEINNDQASFFGGRIGVIINHNLKLGIGGYSLLTHITSDEVIDGEKYDIDMSYGGIEIEYAYKWDEAIHYTAILLIGGGSVSYRDDVPADEINYSDDQFFVAEPGANIEFNLSKNFRFDVGAGYRLVSRVFFGDLSSKELSGFIANITLKFGSF